MGMQPKANDSAGADKKRKGLVFSFFKLKKKKEQNIYSEPPHGRFNRVNIYQDFPLLVSSITPFYSEIY